MHALTLAICAGRSGRLGLALRADGRKLRVIQLPRRQPAQRRPGGVHALAQAESCRIISSSRGSFSFLFFLSVILCILGPRFLDALSTRASSRSRGAPPPRRLPSSLGRSPGRSVARSSEDMAMAMTSSGGRTSDARTNQLGHMLKAWVASPVQILCRTQAPDGPGRPPGGLPSGWRVVHASGGAPPGWSGRGGARPTGQW